MRSGTSEGRSIQSSGHSLNMSTKNSKDQTWSSLVPLSTINSKSESSKATDHYKWMSTGYFFIFLFLLRISSFRVQQQGQPVYNTKNLSLNHSNHSIANQTFNHPLLPPFSSFLISSNFKPHFGVEQCIALPYLQLKQTWILFMPNPDRVHPFMTILPIYHTHLSYT